MVFLPSYEAFIEQYEDLVKAWKDLRVSLDEIVMRAPTGAVWEKHLRRAFDNLDEVGDLCVSMGSRLHTYVEPIGDTLRRTAHDIECDAEDGLLALHRAELLDQVEDVIWRSLLHWEAQTVFSDEP